MVSMRVKQKAALLIVFSMIAGLLCHYSALTDRGSKGSRSAELLRNWYKEYSTEGNQIEATGSGGAYTECDSYNWGAPIWVYNGIVNANGLKRIQVSIGYRAYKTFSGNRHNGFVTVGHGVSQSLDNYIYASSTGSKKIGRIEYCRYNNQIDASFVRVIDSNSITKKIGCDTTMNTSVYTVKTGDKVWMYGGKSGLKVNIPVRGVNQQASYGKVTLQGMIVTDKMSQSGDSGSPVFYFTGSSYRLVGIVVADNSYSSIVEPEAKIRSAIGAYPY